MDIKLSELFPIKVWSIKTEYNTSELVQPILNMKPYLLYSQKSGGYQGGDELSKLTQYESLENVISTAIKNTFNSEFKMLDMWVSIYDKYDYNNIHNHPPFNPSDYNNPLYSGVLYIKTPNSSGGFVIHSNKNVTDKHVIYPQSGDLIIFNSSTYHSVEPNLSDEERICIAFNFILTKEENNGK